MKTKTLDRDIKETYVIRSRPEAKVTLLPGWNMMGRGDSKHHDAKVQRSMARNRKARR